MKIEHLLMLITAVLAVSSASIFVVLANAPGMVVAFWRLVISIPLFIILNRSFRLPENRMEVIIPAVSGFALGIHFSSWMESLFYASVAVSTTIVCTHSLFSGIFSSMFGEMPRMNQITGVIVALAGVYLLSGADPSSSIEGIILALIGAVFGGLYFATGRYARDKVDFGTYIVFTYLFAAIVALFIAVLSGSPLTGYSLNTWMFFALLAVIPMLLGHTLLNYLLRHMEVLPVTSSVIGEAMGSAILAYIVLNQTLQVMAWVYILLILAGIAIALKD
ncbi:putative permease, DMT superfamily [Archaeoglobus sulfaticallidus PM70-1]|uniref:Putative permease, DMT superfamily n=1 Tax=Archaeoglobus sulfaticallidus PM70-1 TaxID=387631 RepID=N0BMZ3_9EURY|nr:DMT family transporter [Archaeoglobus sulfaticallidus]AGK61976.1 putative permease, DMT superfamily [Archaeoglobus sulfaticallidus PM70-1]